MKVYIITTEPFPNGMAATTRIKCYAKALMSVNIACEVIITRRTERYGTKPRNVEGINLNSDVPFFYIGRTPLRASNVISRKYYDLYDERKLISFISNEMNTEDVIITYMREHTLVEKILKYAHLKGIKVVRDLCEYPFPNVKKYNNVEKLRKAYFDKVFPKFNGIICISEALLNVALRFKGENAKLLKLPIMINEKNYDYSLVEKKEEEHPYLFHGGTLYQQKDGILDVLEAFGKAKKSIPFPVKYLFTGSVDKSPESIEIKKIIREYNLNDSVEFLGYLSDDSLKSYIKGAKGFIINKLDNLQNKHCFATKLAEYLLSGNPVITTNVGEAKYYLENSKSAILIESGNVELLTEKIIDLFMSEYNCDIGENGKKVAISNFSAEKQGDSLKSFLSSL